MKRSLFYLLGNIILALGIVFLIKAQLGTGSWDALNVGLSKTVGLSVGTWEFAVGAVVLFINKFLSKDKLDISALLTLFLDGFFIDLFLKYIGNILILTTLYSKIVVFVAGIVLLALGIAIYIQSKFATSPIDNLMISLNKRFGISYRLGRTIGEASALSLGLLFHGPIFIGTLIVAFSVGPLIQIFHRPVEKLYQAL